MSEELFYRQFLPLLLVIAFGNLLLAVVLSAAAFGLRYRYRGWRGMVAATLLGLMLSGTYLFTGSLLVVMVAQVMVIFNRLVIDPIAFWPVRQAPPARG